LEAVALRTRRFTHTYNQGFTAHLKLFLVFHTTLPFGCILYELSVGYPLFPGEDEKEHMALMMEVKGVPPRSVLARATRRRVFFDDDY
jgi:hypothetical protein